MKNAAAMADISKTANWRIRLKDMGVNVVPALFKLSGNYVSKYEILAVGLKFILPATLFYKKNHFDQPFPR